MKRIRNFAATLIAAIMVASSVSAHTEATVGDIERCEASWYGPGMDLHLQPDGSMKPQTSTGQVFNMDDPTIVAHKTLPIGTEVRVTIQETGQSLELIVQDRGPHVDGRCVDLSRGAARAIGMYCGPRCGTADVVVEVIRLPE